MTLERHEVLSATPTPFSSLSLLTLPSTAARGVPEEILREDVCSALEDVVDLEQPLSAKTIPAKEPEKKPAHFRYIEKDLRSLHKDLVHTR
uniref:Uncharacterized protein n=1 Tax=Sphaerodactylus townsendi TaxID=933632 RepID=A0ACB8FXY7_9SAUR